MRIFKVITSAFTFIFAIANSSTAYVQTNHSLSFDDHLLLVREYVATNMDSAHFHVDQAIAQAEEFRDKNKLAEAYNYKGYLHFFTEEYDLAVRYYLGSKLIYNQVGNHKKVESLIDNVMNIADQNGIPHLAVYYGQERIKRYGSEFGYQKEAEMHMDLGMAYLHQGSPILANVSLFEARNIILEEGNGEDKQLLSMILYQLGITQFELSQKLEKEVYLDSALQFYKESLSLDNSLLNQAKVITNQGNTYFELGQHDKAVTYFHKALKVQKETGMHRLSIPTLNNLARFHYINKQYDSAKYYFKAALAHNLREKSSEENLKDDQSKVLFHQTNELELSLQYIDSLALLDPTLVSSDDQQVQEYYTTRLLMDQKLEAQIGSSIQQENFIAQQKEKAQKQAREELILIAWIGGLSLLIVLLAIVARVFYRKFNREKRDLAQLREDLMKLATTPRSSARSGEL